MNTQATKTYAQKVAKIKGTALTRAILMDVFIDTLAEFTRGSHSDPRYDGSFPEYIPGALFTRDGGMAASRLTFATSSWSPEKTEIVEAVKGAYNVCVAEQSNEGAVGALFVVKFALNLCKRDPSIKQDLFEAIPNLKEEEQRALKYPTIMPVSRNLG